jgi:hypothetical protein
MAESPATTKLMIDECDMTCAKAIRRDYCLGAGRPEAVVSLFYGTQNVIYLQDDLYHE